MKDEQLRGAVREACMLTGREYRVFKQEGNIYNAKGINDQRKNNIYKGLLIWPLIYNLSISCLNRMVYV